MRRPYLITTAALGLALAGVHAAPVYGRAAHSARSFRHYFQDLKSADANLNPVERVMFSLILANTEQPQQQR
jgi:hypothetical protein